MHWSATAPDPKQDPLVRVNKWRKSLPVLIVNGALDQQTVLEGAQAAKKQFSKAVLLTAPNDTHVVFPRNACVQETVIRFIVTRTLPAPNECAKSNPSTLVLGPLRP